MGKLVEGLKIAAYVKNNGKISRRIKNRSLCG